MKAMLRTVVLGMAVTGVGPTIATAQDAPPPPAAPANAPQADVPVTAVVLFSSGVGYFEHFGKVTGEAKTELRFKTEQINDILKSLVLEDLDKGRVNNVTYPSQDPIAKTLRSFQVDITNNPSLAELLNQLRGARVSGNLLSGQKFAGTVLGVEKKKRPVGEKQEPVEVAVLNLLSGAQINSVSLDEVGLLTLEDAELQAELNKALTALSQARDQDKKPVVISFAGDGERRVRVGYVVQTPVWKTSYRLILPAEKEPGRLQGWAIVENQTDNDWSNVQLSLVSGRPISFIQDLYQPLYVGRPVVEPELYASLRPQRYSGGFGGGGAGGGNRENAPAPAASPAPAMQDALEKQSAKRGRQLVRAQAEGVAADADEEATTSGLFAGEGVESVASAASVGELFQYTVRNVNLPRQKSAMLPIVTDETEIERLSIYNMSVMPRHPLNGARLKNTTGKHLLAGPVTVFDGGSYAGDAQIENLPPGQERLVSYGIDLKMQVNPQEGNYTQSVLGGRIVKGVLEVTYKDVRSRTYAIENKGEVDKTLVIEHPHEPQWKLVDTPEPAEKTESLYRFKRSVAPGKPTSFEVKEQFVRAQEIAILPMDLGQLQAYMQTGEIPQPVKDALGGAMELKRAMVDTERQIADRQRRQESYPNQQNRIRENMKVIDRTSDLYKELHGRLQTQEQEIVRLQDEVETLRKRLEEQRAALENYLNGLSVG